jgi:ABC-type amino acid transport substrate-binding protein
MFELLHLDEFFVHLRNGIVYLCQEYPWLAGAVIFVLIIALAYIVLTGIIEFLQRVRTWVKTTSGIAGLTAGFIIALFVSVVIVVSIRAALAPVPMLVSSFDSVLGEAIHLRWTYDARMSNGLRTNAQVQTWYEVQSAADSSFTKDVQHEDPVDSQEIYVDRFTNGERFWRVRAVTSDPRHAPISSWSAATQITQYESHYGRIASTGTISVYTSSSANQGFFKFPVKGRLKGADVKLAEAIVAKLPALMKLDDPKLPINDKLTVSFAAVPWKELLGLPGTGQADMIISTITRRTDREQQYRMKFSEPYYCTTQSLLFRDGQAEGSIRQIVAGKKVGVQVGTTGEQLVVKLAKDMDKPPIIERAGQTEDLVNALVRSPPAIDYAVTDAPFAFAAHLRKPQLAYKEFGRDDFPSSVPQAERVEEYAVAVSVSELRLLNAINKIIGAMKDDGSLIALFRQAASDYLDANKLARIAGDDQIANDRAPWKCP